jgi:hypothetical protein
VEIYGTPRQATDGNIIRRMRFACWITKSTRTHARARTHTHTQRICNNYCFATATMFTRTRFNVTRVHTLSALCLLNLSNPSAQDSVAFPVSKTLRSN